VTAYDEPTLEGMPEVPPAWVRPDRGVRLSALALDRMLQAALPHAGTDEDLPVLMGVHLSVADGLLTLAATDRYTMLRERRPVSQTCDDFTFLLRAEDASSLRVLLKSVLRGLKDEARDEEPCDLALELTDDGPTLRVLGHDLDVRFTQLDGEYPRYGQMVDNILQKLHDSRRAPFDAALNPTLLARVVPSQRAGRLNCGFRFSSAAGPKGRPLPIVVETTDPDDDLVIAIMPITLAEQQ
jgi:hypothetical protein